MRKTNTFAAVSEPTGRRMVTVSEQERIDDENRRRMLADGLARYKDRNYLTNAQLGLNIGVGEKTVAKLLGSEMVKLTGEQYYRAWRLAGYLMCMEPDKKNKKEGQAWNTSASPTT